MERRGGEEEEGEGEGGVLEYLHRAGNYYDSHTVSDVVWGLWGLQLCCCSSLNFIHLNYLKLVFVEISKCQKNDDLVNDLYDKKNKQMSI